ncbi:MAG: dipeptidase [Halodesulfurarchaeum sp.]
MSGAGESGPDTDANRPVFDGHNDTLLAIGTGPDRGGRPFDVRSDEGHLDLPRANDAGYGGGMFAIWVPNSILDRPRDTADGYEIPLAPRIPTARAKRFTYDRLADIHRLSRRFADTFEVVGTPEELRSGLRSDSLIAVPHLEGAAAIEPDCSNLDLLYRAGVRSIGLTWSRPNAFGRGVPFRYPATPDIGEGLTDAGRDLVRACNERGILLDLAHLNAAGFWDVEELTTDPLVVSHTGVHALAPTTRNVTDDQLDAVEESGGLVGIQFGVENLRADGDRNPDTPISRIVDHITYVADRIGIDHVGLGSDFDGCTVPAAIGDVTGLPLVFDAMEERGFGPDARSRIARKNWVRVLSDTWTSSS